MKYIRAFFGFWRKFIVGDDSRIAIIIMWALLFIKSLSENFINGWFVVPVTVLLLFAYLTYVAMKKVNKPSTISLFWAGLVPMIFVVAIPTLLFRINVGTVESQFTFIPLSICIVVGSISTVFIYKVLHRFPILSLFILGCISLGLMTIWQAEINSLSYNIVRNYSAYGDFIAPLIVLGFVVFWIVSLLKGIRTKANTEN
jgi:hypothetical protein